MNSVVDQQLKRVVYLYNLVKGVSSKSYGMHVALAAGISEEITNRAEEIAQKFELATGLSR
jgi:DNA mismatch repair ATPase MutS